MDAESWLLVKCTSGGNSGERLAGCRHRRRAEDGEKPVGERLSKFVRYFCSTFLNPRPGPLKDISLESRDARKDSRGTAPRSRQRRVHKEAVKRALWRLIHVGGEEADYPALTK